MSRPGSHPGTEGFGLIEAIVALLVVSMAAIALFDLITGAAGRDAKVRARWGELASAKAAIQVAMAAPRRQEGWYTIIGPDRRRWWARDMPWKPSDRLRRVDIAKEPGAPAVASTLYLEGAVP